MPEFRNEEGYTLILVLWTLVILTLIFAYLADDIIIENFLLENNKQEKELREVALEAKNIALNTLLNDETEYDSQQVNWLEPIEGEKDGIEYTVIIEDMSSKLNLNYSNIEILEEIDNIEIAPEHLEYLIADLFFLKDQFKESEYMNLESYTTTYGEFNINYDQPENLQKIFDFLDIRYGEMVIEDLKKYREDGERINNLDQLPFLLERLDLSTFDKIKEYLRVDGRININLAHRDLLSLIFNFEGIEESFLDQLIVYREENEIEDIDQLKELLNEDDYNKIAGYFTSRTQYVKLLVNSKNSSNRVYQISVIIKRELIEDNWSVDIVSYSEKNLNQE